MICRFYGAYTLQSVRDLTMGQVNILLEQMGEIVRIESGEGSKPAGKDGVDDEKQARAMAMAAKHFFRHARQEK